MIAILLAHLWSQDLQDRVERALEDGRTSSLRAEAPADVERAVRRLRRGPFTGEPDRILERRTSSGASYALHVPPGYDPARAWPLLVTLHGANAGGDPAAGRDWIRTWLRCPAARAGWILLSPTSAVHTWSARPAQGVVFEALREVQRELHVDPDRIHLDGFSMGAGGAFRLAAQHPDRWASVGPRGNVPDVRRRSDGTLVTMSPENLRALPVYWVFGAKDEKIPVEFARAARAALEREGVPLVYREFPEGGHAWNLEDDDAVLAWYAEHPRRTYPEAFTFKSWEKSFQRAYWIEILRRGENGPVVMVHLDMHGKESERRTEYRPPALVRARRSGQEIVLETEEVRSLRVWLSDAMLDLDRPVRIRVDGRTLHDGKVRRSAELPVEEARRRDDRRMTFTAYVDLKPP